MDERDIQSVRESKLDKTVDRGVDSLNTTIDRAHEFLDKGTGVVGKDPPPGQGSRGSSRKQSEYGTKSELVASQENGKMLCMSNEREG
jgi:hypothetical protein